MSVASHAPDALLNTTIDQFQGATAAGDGPDIDFHFPATLRPRLIVIKHGAASLVAADGSCTLLPSAFVAAPKGAPRTYRIATGTELIMAIFSAGSYNRFFSAPLSGFTQCAIALEALMPAAVCQGLVERIQAARSQGEALQLLKEFLTCAMGQDRQRPGLRLPRLSPQMLAIPSPELARLLNLSERQFERLFRAAYGMPLREYRKLLRYKSALALLLTRPCEPGMVTRIAQECAYFDQSHFIRDFRAFVGSSPGEFLKKCQPGASSTPRWHDTSAPFILLNIDDSAGCYLN